MDKEKTKLKQLVIKTYSGIASQGSCCAMPASCCAPEIKPMSLLETGRLLGYADKELKEEETVLDLGSGAEFDAFLSAMKVGKNGRVIGVDMTPEMRFFCRFGNNRITGCGTDPFTKSVHKP
jgi:arsenite methyltransferase